MKLKPHGYFLVDFVNSFACGEMSRFDFDLDYSGYIIEHFPYFREEHPRLAQRFVDTIEVAYVLGEHQSDEELQASMVEALDDFLSNRQSRNLF